MFLSVVALVSLDKATIFVEHPHLSINAPAVIGKPSTPTPHGVYLVKRGYSKALDQRVLIFRQEGRDVWAIHANLPSRASQLKSDDPNAKRLSAGCIGVSQEVFDKLWNAKPDTLILQVY